MRNFSKTLLPLILLCVVSSCASIKDANLEQPVDLKKSDYKKLNGEYANHPAQSEGVIHRSMLETRYVPRSLWSQITGSMQSGREDSIQAQTVTFDFISNKRAVAQLWSDGKLVKSKKMKGRIKDKYFYRRPYFVVVPFFPLFFGHAAHRYRIGVVDNDIAVDYAWNYWMFAVLAGNHSSGHSNSIFERENK